MDCRLGNKECDGKGNIYVNELTTVECGCVVIRKAERSYLDSGGQEEHKKFLPQIQYNPNVGLPMRTGTGKPTKMPFKSILSNYLKHLDAYIQKQHHIIAYGDPETGKTLFGSSLILHASLKGYSAKIVDMREFRERVLDKYHFQDYKKELLSKDILMLDDVGVEAIDDFHFPTVINYLDFFIRKHKGLLIFTSNKKVDENHINELYKSPRLTSALFKKDHNRLSFSNTQGEFRKGVEE